MSFISLQTVTLVLRPFDIGPTGTLTAVETLYSTGPHLHEIGLRGSPFGRSKQLSAVSNQQSATNCSSGNHLESLRALRLTQGKLRKTLLFCHSEPFDRLRTGSAKNLCGPSKYEILRRPPSARLLRMTCKNGVSGKTLAGCHMRLTE